MPSDVLCSPQRQLQHLKQLRILLLPLGNTKMLYLGPGPINIVRVEFMSSPKTNTPRDLLCSLQPRLQHLKQRRILLLRCGSMKMLYLGPGLINIVRVACMWNQRVNMPSDLLCNLPHPHLHQHPQLRRILLLLHGNSNILRPKRGPPRLEGDLLRSLPHPHQRPRLGSRCPHQTCTRPSLE